MYNGANLSTNFILAITCPFSGGPMENTPSLRRQAAFCLRLSEFCCDELLANHLKFKAADYHQRALRSEFNLPHDGTLS
jgi:hypothetical protein